jgi:ATP-binding cassette subfamily B protein
LHGISLEIPAGSSLAIVGPTGCGKTTLLNILGRLIDPPDDTVFCGGDDIRQLKLETLRRSISMVPQESFLFSDTLRGNLSYANRDASVDDIERVVIQAALDECVKSLSNGLDTVVGERGVTLSGGQKQRVAIARALLERTPTLILDDALSAVDTSTEEELLAHIGRAMENRTTILVAHRLSSIRRCDQIVVMREGRIHESGTHHDLLQQGSWYAETWRRQLLAKELEGR